MVELPRRSLSGTVTPLAQSSVSGREIGSAYSALANELDAVGDDFAAIAEEEAALEGRGAPYRDEKGNLVYAERSGMS
ncbi:MAG: hypothetical protein ACREIB_10120, partial [Pseudomonadota bacterium]